MISTFLGGASVAQARFKFVFAQPLAPGVIGVSWRSLEAGKSIRLYRIGPQGETRIGDFDASRTSYVDAGSFQPGELVRYRVAELAGEKEKLSVNVVASNSAELIAEGDFETQSGLPLKWSGFNLSMPEPVRAELAEGGMPPGKHYLKVTMPDGSLRYSLRKHHLWVYPPTKYTFSFWTTDPSPVLAKGSISIFTEKLEKSLFGKVTWYRLSPAQRTDGWVKISYTRVPLKDERIAGLEISPERSDYAGTFGIDNFSIIDHDIQYLEKTDIGQSIATARSGAQKFPDLAASSSAAIVDTIESLKASMADPAISVDGFLAQRARLCDQLRKLDAVNALFEVAEIPEN